ncbi:hypothetical protein Taro_020887 [Colocasia esculenta]|uniref:C2H2-type domain-containing protein n=1 Tax=Colocasia esculenta TaxID=4460 RepID=A0A843UXI6_COLES|nr:hypothetical protein [Colocasia esculenta]
MWREMPISPLHCLSISLLLLLLLSPPVLPGSGVEGALLVGLGITIIRMRYFESSRVLDLSRSPWASTSLLWRDISSYMDIILLGARVAVDPLIPVSQVFDSSLPGRVWAHTFRRGLRQAEIFQLEDLLSRLSSISLSESMVSVDVALGEGRNLEVLKLAEKQGKIFMRSIVPEKEVGQPGRSLMRYVLQYLMPFVDEEQYQISTKCRLHPDNDMFREQENHKVHVEVNEWRCGFCKKSFRAEKFLDMHFDNRHYNLLNDGHPWGDVLLPPSLFRVWEEWTCLEVVSLSPQKVYSFGRRGGGEARSEEASRCILGSPMKVLASILVLSPGEVLESIVVGYDEEKLVFRCLVLLEEACPVPPMPLEHSLQSLEVEEDGQAGNLNLNHLNPRPPLVRPVLAALKVVGVIVSGFLLIVVIQPLYRVWTRPAEERTSAMIRRRIWWRLRGPLVLGAPSILCSDCSALSQPKPMPKLTLPPLLEAEDETRGRCLADLCGALHCDQVIESKKPKSKCNPAAVARNRHLCESLADSCFPINQGRSASRLHELFLRQFCDAHTCTGGRKPFSRGGRKQTNVLYLAMCILILILLPLFYLLVYLSKREMKDSVQVLKRISKGKQKKKPT